MLTYDTALLTLQQESGVPSTDTTASAQLIRYWNESRRTVAGIAGGKWPWLEIEEEVDTTANQDYVQIPNHIEKVISVRQQNGDNPTDVIYRPRMIFSAAQWDAILSSLWGPSDVPRFTYQRGEKLYIFPTPNTTGNRVIMHGRMKIRDINIADVTNITVTAIANGSTTVTLSGSATADFVGRWIRITQTSADGGGDGYWYEIAGFTNATTVTLKKPYQGTTLAAATAACTIGFITYEPEQWQSAPIYRALARYWNFKENTALSERYWRLYDGGYEAGISNEVGGMVLQMIEEAMESAEGNYMPPTPRDNDFIAQYPPYYYPWSLGSGF